MTSQTVILLEVGQPTWSRWMVYHCHKRRFWRYGTWKKLRRNGELWASKSEAEHELAVARAASQAN